LQHAIETNQLLDKRLVELNALSDDLGNDNQTLHQKVKFLEQVNAELR
jgi:hypothetical protein